MSEVLGHKATTLALLKKEEASSTLAVDKVAVEIRENLELLISEIGYNNGDSLQMHTAQMGLQIVEAIESFVCLDSDINQNLGMVWKATSAMVDLPQSNVEHVADILSNIVMMLDDAMNEAIELLQGFDFDGIQSSISEVDKKWIKGVVTLIKTAILCIKRCQALLRKLKEQEIWIQVSERILKISNTCSEYSDDLVSSLELPLQPRDSFIQLSIKNLSTSCRALVNESLELDQSQKWPNMCNSQLDTLENVLEL